MRHRHLLLAAAPLICAPAAPGETPPSLTLGQLGPSTVVSVAEPTAEPEPIVLPEEYPIPRHQLVECLGEITPATVSQWHKGPGVTFEAEGQTPQVTKLHVALSYAEDEVLLNDILPFVPFDAWRSISILGKTGTHLQSLTFANRSPSITLAALSSASPSEHELVHLFMSSPRFDGVALACCFYVHDADLLINFVVHGIQADSEYAPMIAQLCLAKGVSPDTVASIGLSRGHALAAEMALNSGLPFSAELFESAKVLFRPSETVRPADMWIYLEHHMRSIGLSYAEVFGRPPLVEAARIKACPEIFEYLCRDEANTRLTASEFDYFLYSILRREQFESFEVVRKRAPLIEVTASDIDRLVAEINSQASANKMLRPLSAESVARFHDILKNTRPR